MPRIPGRVGVARISSGKSLEVQIRHVSWGNVHRVASKNPFNPVSASVQKWEDLVGSHRPFSLHLQLVLVFSLVSVELKTTDAANVSGTACSHSLSAHGGPKAASLTST